jgi:hypothetical protein
MGASSRLKRKERLPPAAHTLLALLRHRGNASAADEVPALGPQAWIEMLDLARRHGVAPLLHRALQARGWNVEVPGSSRFRLDEDRRATALDNLRNYGEFRRIARALHDRNIPVMPLKGLHLAELVYGDIGLRPMSDLDILVPVSQLRHVITTVHGLGYGSGTEVSDTADAMLDTKCDIELAHRRTGGMLEVHWSLGEPPGRYVGLLAEVWRRAVPATVGDADALVMAPEFLLLHVCAHLSCHHVFALNLRALCDIAEIVRKHPAIDWAVVVDHSRHCGWGRGVAAALRLAGDHLGVPVPAEVRTALGLDAIEPEMLADALEHLLTHIDVCKGGFEWHHAVNLRTLAGQRRTAEKLATVWQRVFVPRAELAMCYGVPRQSKRLSLYYAVRLKDLLCRYTASAWALSVSDPRLAAAAARHARLAKWIAGA